LRESLHTDKHSLQKLNGIIFSHVEVQHEAQVSIFWEGECAETPSLARTYRKEGADSGHEATTAISGINTRKSFIWTISLLKQFERIQSTTFISFNSKI
jgi:hypothetical protein